MEKMQYVQRTNRIVRNFNNGKNTNQLVDACILLYKHQRFHQCTKIIETALKNR